jgi:ATP-binding cassette subfamily C protein CydD
LILNYPWLFIAAIFSAEVGAILLIFQLKIITFFIDGVIFKGLDLVNLTRLLTPLFLIILTRAILIFVSEFNAKKLAILVKTDFRAWLTEKIVRMDSLQHYQIAALQSVFIDDVEALDAYFSQYVPQIILAVFLPVTLLVFVFPLDLLSGWILLLTAPLIPFFMILIGKYSQKETEKQFSVLHKMSNFFLDSIQGIKTLILLNQSEKHLERIRTVSKDYRDKTMQVLRITFLSAFSLELISTISTAVLAVEIGLRLLYGRMEFNQAFLILLIAPKFYIPLRNLGLRFHAAKSALAAAKNIYKIMDTPLYIPEKTLAKPGLSNFSTGKKLTFENVTAGFQKDIDILENINFEIPSGSKTALVGASGSGKSTVFQLLMRFLRPSQGNIYLNGNNIEAYDVEQWRSNIAWVPQNPMIFNGTIAENILIAKPAATKEELKSAIRMSGLDIFLSQQSLGEESYLMEFGRTISRGEKQRIALARAFLKSSQLVLFDEPTAALDADLETFIQNSINQLSKRSTVIVIAHRIHTIKHMEKIVCFDKGKVVGYGNHAALLRSNPAYQKFNLAYFGERK